MTDTVLVTGISGFIAKHVALELLRQGHAVRGTVRDVARGDAVRDTLARHGADVRRLSFVAADLTSDAGWDDAIADVRYVQHIASPFPMAQPRDREALVPAARDGALRVLRRALDVGVERIVMTSSIVAMMYRAHRPATYPVGEDDWTDLAWNRLSAYVVSKTRAERAAWDLMRERDAAAKLSVVNPGLVLGPALDGAAATSLDLVKLALTGAYPAMPPIAFACVDVRDVAALHVAAMTQPEAGGRRLIGARDTLRMADMCAVLRRAFPERARKIPKWVLPVPVTRLAALFDANIRAVLPDLGAAPQAQSDYVTALTGVRFLSGEDAVRAAGQSLIDLGVA